MTDRGSDSHGDGSDREPGDRTDDRRDGTSAETSRAQDSAAESPSNDRETATSNDPPRSPVSESPDSGDDTHRTRESAPPTASSPVTIEEDGVIRWFLKTNDGTVVYLRDIATSVGLVLFIALVLFGISGVWPPLVAVESGSMEPNMQRGDMIFVVEDERFVGDGAIGDTGIVTRDVATETGRDKFGQPGDVIIFRPGGSDFETPVIHRAHFWVEKGENWVQRYADPQLTNGKTCTELRSCPAEYDGFVTKGDANPGYDQAGHGADTNVVKPEWVEGKAAQRIPWLGYIRLTVDEVLGGTPSPAEVTPFAALAGGLVLSGRRV